MRFGRRRGNQRNAVPARTRRGRAPHNAGLETVRALRTSLPRVLLDAGGACRCRSDRPFFAEDPVRRGAWHEAIRILLGARGFSHVQEKRPPSWLEVRPQTCESYAAALECGFAPFTISDENAAVEAVRSIKGNAVQGDLLSVNVAGSLDVLSVQGLLERVPFPDMYLRRAQALLPAKGRLLLSFSNTAGMAWKTAAPETRPAWSDQDSSTCTASAAGHTS